MAVFAMGDLHLPLSENKPMDVFGNGWQNYVSRIETNWNQTVGKDDIVILCGDTSWATYMSDALADFSFVDRLNGFKLISKGNHDYWWTTANKMNLQLEEWGIKSISFLHNSSYLYENIGICASRGYFLDDDSTLHDRKIYEREKIRIRLSVESVKRENPEKIILALHYPPDEEYRKFITEEMGVDVCVFGHLHGEAARKYEKRENFFLVSSDYLEFIPKKIQI